jgi:hypothetical protein
MWNTKENAINGLTLAQIVTIAFYATDHQGCEFRLTRPKAFALPYDHVLLGVYSGVDTDAPQKIAVYGIAPNGERSY